MSRASRRHIYLDHSATTPVAPEVVAAMQPFWSGEFGNASSLHSFGRDAAAALDQAHNEVANALGARASEIVFTGGGTESDNLALRGAAFAMRERGRGMHVIGSPAEHLAVDATLHQLRDVFGFELTELPVDGCGRVNPDDVRRALRPDTTLVSVMLANNEVGTLNDVAAIADICHQRGVLLHTDAVQAPAYVPVDVSILKVDFLALSAHKFYGPKGAGVLYIREGSPFVPLSTGGGHERGRRPGTVNVAACVGTAAALKRAVTMRDQQAGRLATLRDRMIAGILADVPAARLTGDSRDRLAPHASFAFKDIDGEALLMALDVEGIAVSTGSACSSGNPEPSPVLLAMGVPAEWALGGLRITLGYGSTDEDVDAVLDILPRCVDQVRRAALA